CAAPFLVDLTPGEATRLTIAPSSRVLSGSPFATSVQAGAPGIVVVQRVSSNGATGQSTPIDDPSLEGAGRLVLVNPLANGFDAVNVMNPTTSAVRISLETVTPSGLRMIGKTYGIEANGVIELSAKAIGGIVDGVLEVVATGRVVASGLVHGALVGSGVLVAVPT